MLAAISAVDITRADEDNTRKTALHLHSSSMELLDLVVPDAADCTCQELASAVIANMMEEENSIADGVLYSGNLASNRTRIIEEGVVATDIHNTFEVAEVLDVVQTSAASCAPADAEVVNSSGIGRRNDVTVEAGAVPLEVPSSGEYGRGAVCLFDDGINDAVKPCEVAVRVNTISLFGEEEESIDVTPAVSSMLPPVDFHGYRRGQELGSGASGQVFACTRSALSPAVSSHRVVEKYAVKAIDLRRMRLSPTAERDRTKLSRELAILKRLPPHDRVVQLIDAFDQGDWMMIVLELVVGGDLYSTITSRKPSRLLEKEASYVTRQLAEGLQFLHGQNVIHRDVKLENILVASELKVEDRLVLYKVKITDFGLSKTVGSGLSQAKSRVGTLPYAAPEVRKGQTYGFSSDLWGLGVVLYILLVGRFPFKQSPVKHEDLEKSAAQLHKVSLVAVGIVYGLLELLPEKRLTLEALIDHEWLRATEKRPHAHAEENPTSAKRLC